MADTLADIQRRYGDSVYPLYKDQMHEPYMEGVNGIGYQGVVMYDEVNDKVQCSECGEWFKELKSHVLFKHKMRGGEYKQYHGLNDTTPLCTPTMSRKYAEIRDRVGMPSRYRKGLEVGWRAKKRKYQSEAFQTVQYKNRHGLCDAQVVARLAVVRERSGGNLNSALVERHDKALAQYLRHNFGSYKKACQILNITFMNGLRYEDGFIIGELRRFVETRKNIPTQEGFRRFCGINRMTIRKHFGSWQRAKMMAGLHQLVREPQVLPTTPGQMLT